MKLHIPAAASAALACAGLAGAARAADKPRVGPPEAWVAPAPPLPAPPKASAGAAVALLWQDVQLRFDAQGSSTFAEVEAKVQSGQGLAALGTVSLAWSPATDTLVVHRLRILRGAQVIDCLPKDGQFTVLRRETNLENAALLDGVLTAVVQPAGLQVGDVLDVAYTVRREDPLLRGRVDADLVGFDAAPVAAFRGRALWPKAAAVRWHAADGLADPRISEHDGWTEARIEATDMEPLAKPQGAPLRFQLGRELTLTSYADWAAVSALMAPLFAEAERLAPGSAVAAQAKAIAAADPDPAARAAAALALVQDKVRYFAQAIGDGGLRPASAEDTWSRRWGDCKAKTALLLALLKALGVQAEPVLASSVLGSRLQERLPALGAFDHVLVRATIGGRDYWLDGTRTGDASLAAIQTPDLGFVLPVRAEGATLMPLRPPPAATPLSRVSVRIDASQGIDKPAPFHVETAIRGDGGLGLRLQLADLAPDGLDRALKAYWRGQYDFVAVSKVSAAFDPASGEERLSMDGTAVLDWAGGGYQADGASLGWSFDAHRDPGPHADAPFAVAYPSYELHEETVTLPDHGEGFSTWGEDVDRKLAGYAFRRHASIAGGVFHMEASARALVPEIDLARAQADAAPLTALSKSGLRIRDPEQTARAAADAKALLDGHPADFDGLLDQGSAFLDAGRFAEALQDFDKAVALQPASGTALADRGLADAWLGQTAAATADLDKAQALQPDQIVTWRARGLLASTAGLWSEAIAAFTRALEIAPEDPFSLLHRAQAYAGAKDFPRALADVDDGLKGSPHAPELQLLRGQLLTALGDRKGARMQADRLSASDATEDRLSRILILLQTGDRAVAYTEADRLVAASPTAQAYLLRAAAREPKDIAGAQADAEAAYAADPKVLAASQMLAALARKAKDRPREISWLEKAIAIAPEDANLRMSLAWARFKVGNDLSQAARDFAEARSRAAGRPVLLNDLCYDQAMLGVNLPAALADCDASLKLDPGADAALDSRAFVLLRMGRNAQARTAYDAATAAQPGDANTLYGRALVERRLGDAAAADRDLKAALARDPTVAATFAGYGVTR